MTPENQIKLALLAEYKKAMRYQDFYFQEIEAISSLIRRAVQYYERQGLEIPERKELYSLVEGLQSVVNNHDEFKKSVLPDETLQGEESKRFRRRLYRAPPSVLNTTL